MDQGSFLARVARVVVSLVCLTVHPPCDGVPPTCPACPTGTCAPNCPVRPGQFGYYPTQWRRWPAPAPSAPAPPDATPAPPARSLVPGAAEESPVRPDEEAAAPRTSAAAAVESTRRLERLVAEADTVRLADADSRRRFTERLVTAMLSEPDPQARCAVLLLAAGFETPASAAICAGALDDPDPRVRLTACSVSVDRRPADAVARLARMARDDGDLGVRLRAVR